MNAKHTPGPWFEGTGWIGAGDVMQGDVICRLPNYPYGPTEANARLISAAPELLASLRAIHHQLTNGEASEGNLRDIRWCASQADAAIAKAEGR